MNKLARQVIAAGILLSLLPSAGCRQWLAGSAVRFNDAITDSNKKLNEAGQRLGLSVGPLLQGGQANVAEVQAAYDHCVETMNRVKADMKALKVPSGNSARSFYEAHQRFLEDQERLIKGDLAEIVRIVKAPSPVPVKQNQITAILQRVSQTEATQLRQVQEAQRAFARDNNLTLK